MRFHQTAILGHLARIRWWFLIICLFDWSIVCLIVCLFSIPHVHQSPRINVINDQDTSRYVCIYMYIYIYIYVCIYTIKSYNYMKIIQDIQSSQFHAFHANSHISYSAQQNPHHCRCTSRGIDGHNTAIITAIRVREVVERWHAWFRGVLVSLKV